MPQRVDRDRFDDPGGRDGALHLTLQPLLVASTFSAVCGLWKIFNLCH